MAIKTTTQLLSDLKQKSALTTGQAGLSDSDLITILTETLQYDLVSEILGSHEEYLLYTEDTALVASQSRYRIPARAIGGRLRHIYVVDSTGYAQVLAKQDQEAIEDYVGRTDNDPRRFVIEGNYVRLLPAVGTNPTSSLRFVYHFQPNQLVAVSSTRQISSFDTAAKTMTFVSVPSTWAVGNKLDIINHVSGNDIVHYDRTITDITGAVVTVSESIADVATSNYVALAGYSPVPMVPEVLHPLLVEMATVRIYEVRNHMEGLKIAKSRVQELLQQIHNLLAERVDSKPDVIVGRNPFLYGSVAHRRNNQVSSI